MHLISSPCQLALFEQDNANGYKIVCVCLSCSTSQLDCLYLTTVKVDVVSLYTCQIPQVNSRYSDKSTPKVEAIIHVK